MDISPHSGNAMKLVPVPGALGMFTVQGGFHNPLRYFDFSPWHEKTARSSRDALGEAAVKPSTTTD
jgi:hypothetical protein